jgi:hypothetical protein
MLMSLEILARARAHVDGPVNNEGAGWVRTGTIWANIR